jgi:predicted dehydrogenase
MLINSAGANMLHIVIGHQISIVTYLLGDLASVSATAATHYPTATLITRERKLTSKTIPVGAPDQIAFTGLFKSGAVSSISWRGGIKSTPGRRQYIWEIDGEEGSIRLEGDRISAALIHVHPPKLYLNGELVEVRATTGMADNLSTAWAEYAKGDKGDYATMEDAVKVHRTLDAIDRSAKEGKTIHLE